MYYFTYINIFIIKKYCSKRIKIKYKSMADADSKNLEKNIFGKLITIVLGNWTILQSVWIRCGAIYAHKNDRKFMERQLRLVLYCGILFWFIYYIS